MIVKKCYFISSNCVILLNTNVLFSKTDYPAIDWMSRKQTDITEDREFHEGLAWQCSNCCLPE